MRNRLYPAMIIWLLEVMAGCAADSKVAPPTAAGAGDRHAPAAEISSSAAAAEPARETAPITLHIKADPQLNIFNRAPHTLVLCVYQLRDARWFNQVQSERNGLQKLLECGRSDSSVVNVKRMVIQPGQEITEPIEADEAIRFINVAAGYYSMKKEGATRSFRVAAPGETRGGSAVKLPQEVKIELLLGPKEIQKVQKR